MCFDLCRVTCTWEGGPQVILPIPRGPSMASGYSGYSGARAKKEEEGSPGVGGLPPLPHAPTLTAAWWPWPWPSLALVLLAAPCRALLTGQPRQASLQPYRLAPPPTQHPHSHITSYKMVSLEMDEWMGGWTGNPSSSESHQHDNTPC